MTSPRFAVGDRVRVTAAWTRCLGRLGTVAEPDEPVRNSQPGWEGHTRREHDGAISYWVELDVGEWVAGVVEAGEFPEHALEPAGQEHERAV
jgi:hypothetical protein